MNLLDAEIDVMYKCPTCGETTFVYTQMIDFLYTKKLKKPKECPWCKEKTFSTPEWKYSFIRGVADTKDEGTQPP